MSKIMGYTSPLVHGMFSSRSNFGWMLCLIFLIIYLTGFKKCVAKCPHGGILYLLPGQYDLYHRTIPHNMANIHKSQVFVKYTSQGNASLQSTPGATEHAYWLATMPVFCKPNVPSLLESKLWPRPTPFRPFIITISPPYTTYAPPLYLYGVYRTAILLLASQLKLLHHHHTGQ